MFGYTRNELLGSPVDLLVPERFRDRHPAHRTGYAREPRVRSMGEGRELYGLRKDGTEFPVEISLSPLATGKERYVNPNEREGSGTRVVPRGGPVPVPSPRAGRPSGRDRNLPPGGGEVRPWQRY
jgi:hypothetical protein